MTHRSTIIVLAVLLVFFFMSTVAMVYSVNTDGMMVSCPTMAGKAVVCENSLLQHIGMWQQMFLALTVFFSFSLLLLIVWRLCPLAIRNQHSLLSHWNFFRAWRSSASPHTSPLTYAFSQGILHPKIYA